MGKIQPNVSAFTNSSGHVHDPAHVDIHPELLDMRLVVNLDVLTDSSINALSISTAANIAFKNNISEASGGSGNTDTTEQQDVAGLLPNWVEMVLITVVYKLRLFLSLVHCIIKLVL